MSVLLQLPLWSHKMSSHVSLPKWLKKHALIEATWDHILEYLNAAETALMWGCYFLGSGFKDCTFWWNTRCKGFISSWTPWFVVSLLGQVASMWIAFNWISDCWIRTIRFARSKVLPNAQKDLRVWEWLQSFCELVLTLWTDASAFSAHCWETESLKWLEWCLCVQCWSPLNDVSYTPETVHNTVVVSLVHPQNSFKYL